VIEYLLFAGLISVSYAQILLKIILTARKVKKIVMRLVYVMPKSGTGNASVCD